MSFILRIFHFIGVKIKYKKVFAHGARRFFNFDVIHIINFIWPNGYVNWDEERFKARVRVTRDTFQFILDEISRRVQKV